MYTAHNRNQVIKSIKMLHDVILKFCENYFTWFNILTKIWLNSHALILIFITLKSFYIQVVAFYTRDKQYNTIETNSQCKHYFNEQFDILFSIFFFAQFSAHIFPCFMCYFVLFSVILNNFRHFNFY